MCVEAFVTPTQHLVTGAPTFELPMNFALTLGPHEFPDRSAYRRLGDAEPLGEGVDSNRTVEPQAASEKS